MNMFSAVAAKGALRFTLHERPPPPDPAATFIDARRDP
jgi:hypothetical protein